MTHANEPDLGPLTWVKGEIDAALERAREALAQGDAGSDGAGLQFAQTHVHQVRGALAIVGLDGLTQFTDMLEQLLGEMSREVVPADAARRALARRALAVIGNYLEELAHGAPDQALRLADAYMELAAARGQKDVSPADLFHPDLTRRPPARAASAATPDDVHAALRGARTRFERGLLDWLRKGSAGEGARTMREAIAEVEALQPTPAARVLWWASLAFYDALIEGSLAPEPAVKRLCTQIDAQFRRLLSGTPTVPDRLLRELLYQIARCPAHTEQQRAVHACWQLDALLPEAGLGVSGTPSAPLLDTLQRQLGAARAHWDDFCAGTAVALAHFEDALAAMEAPAAALARPRAQALVAALLEFARWLRRDPLQFADAAAMEVATALLLLEAGLERRPPDAGFAARVDAMVERLHALQRGETPSVEAGDAVRAGAAPAAEKALLEQLSKEMLVSLGHVEQALDGFFRNPSRREPLLQLHQPLQQIVGALSVLGETDALALVRDAAVRIAGLAREDSTAGQAEFEALAHQLSALGFHIEALPRGGAPLQDLLGARPTTAAAPELPTPELPAPDLAAPELAAPELAAPELAAPELAAPELVPTEAVVEPAVAPLAEPLFEPLFEPIGESLSESPPDELPEILVDAEAFADAAGPQPQPFDSEATRPEDFMATANDFAAPEAAPAFDEPSAPGAGEDLELELIETLEELEPTAEASALPRLTATDAAAPAAPPAETAQADAGIDAELLAIFIEEAVDVLATVATQLQTLRADPRANEALVTIRRGFHTLKGSGRMVGLAELGETAWAVEQTLNRWLQLDWTITAPLLDFIAMGHEVFSAWVARLQAGDPRGVDDEALLAEAARLREADTAPMAPAPAPATAAEAALPEIPAPEAAAETEGESAPEATASELLIESADFVIEGELGFAAPPEAESPLLATEPAGATGEPGAKASDEAPAGDDATPPPEAPATAAPAYVPEAAEVEPPDSIRIGDVELSRALYELYCSEARQHLDTLADELRQLAANPRPPAKAALRAAHTLAGISGTARLPAPHQLGRALEHAMERLAERAAIAQPGQLERFDQAVRALEAMLGDVLAARLPAPQPELIAALEAADDLPCDAPPAAAAAAEPEDLLEADFVTDLETEAAPEFGASLETKLETGFETAVTSDLEAEFEPLAEGSAWAPAEARRPTEAEAAAESAPAVSDDIDHDLLPIFLEEAAETLTELHALLRRWRDEPDAADASRQVARLLHSLKGSARMAGAMSLGAHLHQLESQLEDGLSTRQAAAVLADTLAHGLDRCEQMIDTLALGERAAPAAASQPATSAKTGAGAAAAQGDDAESLASPTLRVRAERVDRFVNQAGEIGVARSRIDGELRTLRRSLLDLTENVIRLRNQLREVEIQAEVQMQSRIAHAGAHAGDFDPLELDRYTRLQELTRMMAESVNDVTTVQQNLLHNLDGADLALNSQARMARELQQGLMQVRMLPFDSLASRLYRVVRQSARELGKRATLDLRGGRIEIDRSVLEQMAAPLEHLLRNAVAHGIEPPAARSAAGKPETGIIELTVSQEGNEIAITIADDGAGLDLERIAARARERGLLGADEHPDERRLTNLIFVSGFSTATELSAVSGRGVGMDVVKAQTAAAGGRVDVSSRRGEGTRFSIRLPLTLAVTQALLVQGGGRTWAIPSNMVVQAMELKPDALRSMQEAHGIDWQGEHYPYRYLPRLLGDREARPEEQRYNWVLLLRAGAQTLALHVDGLRGNQEIIVKNAGPQLTRIVGMTGATVLGDGEIVLILNPVALASRGLAEEVEGLGLDSPAAEAPPPLHLPTVMVVDDSLTVRKITGRLLEREGYRVITAKDGVDALEQLLDTLPDVVLSDIEMPRMDGFDLVRNIRADARLAHLPVIMITSRLAEKHRRYAEEVGANHYLGKPYQEEELLELVAGYTQGPAPSPH